MPVAGTPVVARPPEAKNVVRMVTFSKTPRWAHTRDLEHAPFDLFVWRYDAASGKCLRVDMEITVKKKSDGQKVLASNGTVGAKGDLFHDSPKLGWKEVVRINEHSFAKQVPIKDAFLAEYGRRCSEDFADRVRAGPSLQVTAVLD